MKIKIILLINMLLLVSAACTLGGSQGRTTQDNVVVMNFLTSQPPTELYESQNFRVGLNLKNYDTSKKSVFVCIYDELSDFFSGVPRDMCKTVSLGAAELSGEKILPSDKRIYFPAEDDFYTYESIKGSMSTSIFAEANYEHKTIANSQICIKKDIELVVDDARCADNYQEQIENNDAPVKITNLKKTVFNTGKNKVALSLRFDVSNVGSGVVINKNAVASREKLEPLIDIKVNLKGITQDFKCDPVRGDGKILFKENQKTIKCDTTFDIEDSYIMNPVEITLNYGYSIKESTSSIKIIDKDEGGK